MDSGLMEGLRMGRWTSFGLVAAITICATSVLGQTESTSPETLTVHWGDANVTSRSENRSSSLMFTTTPDAGTSRGDAWFDPATMMRATDVRPGMRGYGLTVFSGLRPERFDAEVLGVHHRFFPNQDLILCRLTAPQLKDLGVVAGMSGSPVYIDGKLIGAVAYGWSDSLDALAGVTPIDAMLEVYASVGETSSTQSTGAPEGGSRAMFEAYLAMRESAQLNLLPRTGGVSAISVKKSGVSQAGTSNLDGLPDEMSLQPLGAPLFMSSASPATLALARDFFAGTGMDPVGASLAGGGAASANAENSPGGPVTDLAALANDVSGGYALAVPMVEGDLSMAGVGTVTWRKGDRLVAFGHPMFQFGSVEFPMAAARINTMVKSRVRPFKLGESVGQIGAVRQDRLPAIGGKFGPPLEMIPVHATVRDAVYSGVKDFNYRVMRHRELTPGLVMTVLAESMAAAGRSGGDAAAFFRYSVGFDDGTTFTQENYLADQWGGSEAAMVAGADVGALVTNPFKKVMLSRMDFDVEVVDKFPEATLFRAQLNRDTVRPGETVAVEWQLSPYRGEPRVMSTNFVVPDNLPDGDYRVMVGDAASRRQAEAVRNPGGSRVLDYESLLRVVKRNFPRNKVYVTVMDADSGVSLHGQELPRLPGSVETLMREGAGEQPYFASVQGNFIVDADIATRLEIKGSRTMTLKVARNLR